MKSFQTSAPGYPTRGFMRHVPMAPEGDGQDSGSGSDQPSAEAAADKKPDDAPTSQSTPERRADTKSDGKPEDVGSILAALKAEREALAAERVEFRREIDLTKADRAKERAAERRQFVRSMGLALPLNDVNLDGLLAPLGDIDPRTDAGRAALNKFRQDNASTGLFAGPVAPESLDPTKVVEDVVGGAANVERKLFGGRAAISMMTPTKKSPFAS